MNLYNVLNDPNAGPISKGLAIAGQMAAIAPILAPSMVKKLQSLLQASVFGVVSFEAT